MQSLEKRARKAPPKEIIKKQHKAGEGGKFGCIYDEPLAKQVLGVRLPESIYQKLIEKKGKNKTDFVREVLTAAIADLE